MARQAVIGIDLGTTALKMGAFDARTGRVLGQSGRRLPVHVTAGGGREQSLRAIDRAINGAMAELRADLAEAWCAVTGVGVAAQGGSSILCERLSGKARTPMFLWNDGRAYPWVQRIAERVPECFWRDFVLHDMPPTGLGRVQWLKETCPDLFREDFIHVGAGEHLFHRLTGVWRQDAGNAIQVGSYNATTRQLDPKAFDLIGVPVSFVAPLRKGHETAPLTASAARAWGLPSGVPVAGPYIDQEAGYMSAAGVSKRPLHCSLGTAWVGNFVLPDDTSGRSPSQMVIPSPVGEGRLVIQALPTGNVTWDWALETLYGRDHGEALRGAAREFARRLLPPEGLIMLPWTTQANPFSPQTPGGGAFLGISPSTTRADLIRAVAAGMTFELARVLQQVKDSGAVDRLVLGGGASKGVHFRKLTAALFAPLPVLWQTDQDLAAARGALFALNPDAARGNAKPVPPPSADETDAATRQFSHYVSVFDRTYGHEIIGKPFGF